MSQGRVGTCGDFQGLRRMCGGIVVLATPELEQEVHGFFTSRKIDLGGKTLEQYLEQLRIAVCMFRSIGSGAGLYRFDTMSVSTMAASHWN
jgi:hypothetical protein